VKKAFLCSVVLLLTGTFAHSQTTSGAQVFDGSVELMSHVVVMPKAVNRKVYATQATYDKFRFDLVNLTNGCLSKHCLNYGDRVGDHWDIFSVTDGAGSRTRMVRIGKYEWTDNFTVPYVEPWPALAPGETRTIMVNTSGGDGADGADGADAGTRAVAQMNGGAMYAGQSVKNPDYAHASLDRQVGSVVKTADGKTRKDPYSPVVEVKNESMYVVHVVDETRDYYLLVRIDELKRGERIVLSYKKLVLP
jgi:hypothetical protein